MAAAGVAWDKAEFDVATRSSRWRNRQNTQAHEFGHMLGLGDEYVGTGAAQAAGKATSHHALTVTAFGQKYADKTAKRVPDSASIMNGGRDLRPLHYVTFWDGLAQLTQTAAAPNPKFGQADWKIQA